MRVLVGVDGSNCSLEAVRFVSKLLVPDRDTVRFFYSPPKVRTPVHRGVDDKELRDQVQTELATRIFARSIAELPEALQANVETMVGQKKAANGLLAAADEHRADLIVVGSHGTSVWERLTLGSVSRTVAHGARVPVLIVREQPEPARSERFRVLLASNQSDASCAAREFIHRFQWPENTSGEVLTAQETYSGQVPEWLAEELRANNEEASDFGIIQMVGEGRENAKAELESWCEDLPAPFQQNQPRMSEGPAARVILNTLKDEKFDLVVLGARQKDLLQRTFLGSTSDYVANHAPCSVLIVRPV